MPPLSCGLARERSRIAQQPAHHAFPLTYYQLELWGTKEGTVGVVEQKIYREEKAFFFFFFRKQLCENLQQAWDCRCREYPGFVF